MKKIIAFLTAFFTLFSFVYSQQDKPNEQNKSVFLKISLAYNLAVYGYENNDPLSLCTAAKILLENPVKKSVRIQVIPSEKTSVLPAKETPLVPDALLEDALKFNPDDILTFMIQDMLLTTDELEPKDRGRKFCPYVQEYLLNPNAEISLKTTFLEKELAEVFLVNYNANPLDLKIYDNKGKLLVSDLDKISNCYVNFVPNTTADYKIVITNRSDKKNQCLLMTN